MNDNAHKPQLIFIPIANNEAKLRAICDTVHKHFYQSQTILLLVASDAAAQYLDELLWKQPEESFIPHAVITTSSQERVAISKIKTNLNQAAVLFNLRPEAALSLIGPHTLIYELIDNTHPDKYELSMQRQKAYQLRDC